MQSNRMILLTMSIINALDLFRFLDIPTEVQRQIGVVWFMSVYNWCILIINRLIAIGNFHDGFIYYNYQNPSFFLPSPVNNGYCYLTTISITKFKYKRKSKKNSVSCSKMTPT